MYGTLLVLHLLAATVWTGGHIVLAVVILPRVLVRSDPSMLLEFESRYERIGMPALIIQVVTGLMLAHRLLPDVREWFNWSNPLSHSILIKLILLSLTMCFAIDARFRIIPVLSQRNLNAMAWHIIPVTLFSVLFVVAGVSFRTGWFY